MTASTPLASVIFRVIDVEGTDRDPMISRPCEVAWRDLGADGQTLGRFETLLDPGVPIPPSASAVHHIVDEDVAGMPTLADVVGDISSVDVFVAHSADYDKNVLGLQTKTWLCTHRLAKHLWPEIGNHSNQEIRYTLKLKPDIPKDTSHHRAAADVAVTAAILAAALPLIPAKWPEVMTIADLVKAANAPALLLRIPFKSGHGQLFEHAETSHLEWIVRTYAGGADCVFTAQHWLDQRYGGDGSRFASDYDTDVED